MSSSSVQRPTSSLTTLPRSPQRDRRSPLGRNTRQERSQVDPGRDAVDLAPPPVWPIAGASHERYLEPVIAALRGEGVAVEFAPIERSSARGYYHLTEKRIRVEAGLEPNARLRTLLHEGAHALVAAEAERDDDAPRLSYAEEECVGEVAGHVAAGALGLDTSGEAVPYVAGWGENDALSAVERAAALVDRIAGWLEHAALADEADGQAGEPRRTSDPHPSAVV